MTKCEVVNAILLITIQTNQLKKLKVLNQLKINNQSLVLVDYDVETKYRLLCAELVCSQAPCLGGNVPSLTEHAL